MTWDRHTAFVVYGTITVLVVVVFIVVCVKLGVDEARKRKQR